MRRPRPAPQGAGVLVRADGIGGHLPFEVGKDVFVRLRSAERERAHPRFLQKGAHRGLVHRPFDGKKAVHPAQHPVPAAAERRFVPAAKEQQRHFAPPAFGLFAGEGEGVAARSAEGEEGAARAEGRGGRADGRAQLHQALGEVAAPRAGQRRLQLAEERPFQRFGGAAVAEQAGQHADHVPVHGGRALAEGDRRDRSRGIVADAGQLFPARGGAGEPLRRHDPGGLL